MNLVFFSQEYYFDYFDYDQPLHLMTTVLQEHDLLKSYKEYEFNTYWHDSINLQVEIN